MMNQISKKNKILVSCPICGSLNYNILFHDRNYRDNIDCWGTYVQCCECSLVYLRDRMPWKDIAKFYSSLNKNYTTNTGQVDVVKLLNQVKKPIPKWRQLLRKIHFRPHSWPLAHVSKGSKRILDIGCGDGLKLFEFFQRGYKVWGIDIGAHAIRLCKQILPEGHFYTGELTDIKLPNNYFDYVRIDNVLEHLPDPREIVRKCYQLLKKDGIILIYVPCGRSLSMRLLKGNSISSWIPFHLQLFTRKSLKQLMYDTRFRDVNIYGYYPTTWLPLSISQRKRRKYNIRNSYHSKYLNLICYPIGWIASKLGLAEELVAVGKR